MADDALGDGNGQPQQSSVQAPGTISSRVVGMLRGLKPDTTSGRQRFENEDDEDDENANVKNDRETQSRPELERRTGGKDVETSTGARTDKKKRVKKKTGDKHERLEEDSDETEHGVESSRKGTKQSTGKRDKGERELISE